MPVSNEAGIARTSLYNTTLNRLGMPDEIAEAAVFLVSDEASYVNGQILGVNGLGAPYGDGSADSPYNVGKAVAVASALADGVNSPEVYIKGIVSKVKSFSSNYGDFTYYITDDGAHVLDDAKYMQVYAGKSFGGEKFSSEEDLKVGDEVILRGTLANYKGNTPEVNKGSVLIQLNGKTE